MARVYHDFIAGSKDFGGRRKTKEQIERERRREAKRAQSKDQAEWVMAHMGEEIDRLRKRGNDGR